MSAPPKQIAIADSQFLICFAIECIVSKHPGYSIAGVIYNLHDLNELLVDSPPDLLITDFASFDYEGFASLGCIVRSYPNTAVLILTNQINRTEFTELNRLGINNIIYKTADEEELLSAMDATLRRKKFYCTEVLDLIVDYSSMPPRGETASLTPSEVEVVRMISSGLTTKEIAARKHVSFHTVMSHRKNIFRKLEVNNVSEMLMRAMRMGIIDAIEYYI
mgnify:CR=1 FL=1